MFMYLVALVATLFIIFGLAYTSPSNDWLRSSFRHPLSLYHDFNYGFTRQARVTNEDSIENSPSRRSLAEISEALEYETSGEVQKVLTGNKERLSDEILRNAGKRSLGTVRYSLENIVQNEKEKDSTLPGTRILQQIGISGTTKASKQNGNKENILQTFKSTVQKSAVVPPPKLTTNEIYNLILKETLKENSAQHKLTESDRIESDGLSAATNSGQIGNTLQEDESISGHEERDNKIAYEFDQ